MKGRLLLAMLILATMMLLMYYRLLKVHPELVSGFITMIAVFITNIVNSAEDILQALFQSGETPPKPKPPILPLKTAPVVPGNPTAGVPAAVVLVCLLLFPGASWAKKPVNTTVINNTVVNPTAVVVTEKNTFGPMVDAPYLVHVTGDWWVGVEGGKDEAYTDTSKGWFGYAKVTYTGTLLDFSRSTGRSKGEN